MASRRFTWPRTMFPHVGEQESSKSAMNAFTGAFRALMIILRSTGPVISTRRSRRSCGTGATVQSPGAFSTAASGVCACTKSGVAPASSSA